MTGGPFPNNNYTPEKANMDWKKTHEPSKGDQSQAKFSSIKHPIEEEQNEKNKKLEALNAILDAKLEPYRQDLSEQREAINQINNAINHIAQAIGINQQKQQQQQPSATTNAYADTSAPSNGKGKFPTLAELPPEQLTGIAQIITALFSGLKGNPDGSVSAKNDVYGELFKQMGLDIVQAGLDGIKQQIYPQFVPQPRPTNYTIPNNPATQPKTSQNRYLGYE